MVKQKEHKKENDLEPIWKTFLALGLSGIKSFFYATVQVAWAISAFFLLIALLTYYKADITYPHTLVTFFQLIYFIEQNWGWIFAVLFIYSWIVDSAELFRALRKKYHTYDYPNQTNERRS